MFIQKCSQVEKCLFSKEQNIQLSDRKFILLVIKISAKEIWEVTKEYENGSKIQFQAFT